MLESRLRLAFAVFTFGLLIDATAQFTNTSAVLDSAGGRSAAGSYTNLSAVGQPTASAESTGGPYVHQGGFLSTFFLKRSLDTDRDGIPDELDTDNDQDRLSDATELAGSAFSPGTVTEVNLADTDGDGVADGFEAQAGTDPTDSAFRLELVRVARGTNAQDISWRARSGKTYVVYGWNDLSAPPTALITNTASPGGSAPWYVVTNSVSDLTPGSNRYYAVEVKP